MIPEFLKPIYKSEKCFYCGENIPVNSRYCIFCGKQLKEIPLSTTRESEVDLFDYQIDIRRPEFAEIKAVLASSSDNMADMKAILSNELKLAEQKTELLLKVEDLGFGPKDFQIEAATKAINRCECSCILADEVGLGKTIEASIIIKELLIRNPEASILILVPASLKNQWMKELFEKFELNAFSDLKRKSGIFILSIHSIYQKEIVKSLRLMQFELVVVDEAHCLKNPATKLYKFVQEIKKKFTICITATPIQNDLKELYYLINLIKPGYFKTIKYFKRKYLTDRFTLKNSEELKLHLQNILIRNRRKNVLLGFPKRNVFSHKYQLSDKEELFYKAILNFCRYIYRKYVESEFFSIENPALSPEKLFMILIVLLKESTSSPSAIISTLKKIMLGSIYSQKEKNMLERIITAGESIGTPAKMELTLKILSSLQGKTIIYTEYLATLKMLKGALLNSGIESVEFHGGLSMNERDLVISAFRGNATVLLSTEVGGQGLNLQFCNNIINYDLPWNPMKIEQRIGRVDRLGQTKDINIINLYSDQTFEGHLYSLLSGKLKLFEMVIGEVESVISYLPGAGSIQNELGKVILKAATDKEYEEGFSEFSATLEEAREQYRKDKDKTTYFLDN